MRLHKQRKPTIMQQNADINTCIFQQFLACRPTAIPKTSCRHAVQQYSNGNLTLQTTLARAEQLTISPALQLIVWRALQQAVGSKSRHTAAVKSEKVQVLHALGDLHQRLVILHTTAFLAISPCHL